MRIREVGGRLRAALAARNGSLTRRRCPTTATSEAARRLRARCKQARGRLVHDPHLWSKSRRHAPPCKLLQRNEAIGTGERTQSRRRIAIDIFVDVGAAQRDDQRPFGVTLAKILDTLRAAPGVQRNHQVRRLSIVAVGDFNVMAELAQNPGPAGGGSPIPGP